MYLSHFKKNGSEMLLKVGDFNIKFLYFGALKHIAEYNLNCTKQYIKDNKVIFELDDNMGRVEIGDAPSDIKELMSHHRYFKYHPIKVIA